MTNKLYGIITAFAMAVSAPAALSAAEVTVSTLDNFAPFTYMEDGEFRGINIDIVEEAAKRAGDSVEFQALPWKRVLRSVEVGEATGGMPAFQTAEREAYAHYTTVPVHESVYVVFVRADSDFEYNGIESLQGMTVGIDAGFKLGDEFENAKGKVFTVDEGKNTEINLKKLAGGRIDAFVSNHLTTLAVAKRLEMGGKFKVAETPVVPGRGAFLMFSKNVEGGADRAAAFSKALESMREDGTIDAIVDKYTK